MEINAGLDWTKLPQGRSDKSSVLDFWYARSVQADDEVSWFWKETEQENMNELGKFLEVCSGCKKNIVGKDAFMYGYLQAFCSPQCRDDQIALDETLPHLHRNHGQLHQLRRSETLNNQFNYLNTHARIRRVSKLDDCPLKFQSDS